MPTETLYDTEDFSDSPSLTIDGVSTIWTAVTTNTTTLFYSANTLTPGEFDENGYVDNLDFNNNREIYYESSIRDAYNTDSGTLARSIATESFNFDALYVPAGGVGILAEYGGDSTDPTADGIDHTHEYNLSDHRATMTFMSASVETVTALIDARDLSARHGDHVKYTALYANYLIPVLESGELAGLKATLGYTAGTTISASINNQIDLLAEDIYNTIPVNRYIFEKSSPFDLKKENFQPITAGELSGIGLLSTITSTTGSTTPTGY